MSDPNVPPQTPPPPVDYAAPIKTGMFAPPAVPVEPPPQQDRAMGMLCHLLALTGLIGIPFGTILGPLVMWLVKKDTVPFVNDQGKEALNFQITVAIVCILASPLICLAGLGLLIIIPVGIAALVFTIIAGIQANNGVWYRYPFSARLLK